MLEMSSRFSVRLSPARSEENLVGERRMLKIKTFMYIRLIYAPI
jgi:hypothetical protein